MLRHTRLEHHFVHFIPDELEPGIIFISMEFATAAHACCCGCGEQVITPFTPTDWKLTFDGQTVSLWPSIGNWNFRCRSHYIICESRIVGAEPWEDKHIDANRRRDKKVKEDYFGGEELGHIRPSAASDSSIDGQSGLWDRLKRSFQKRYR